MQQKEFLGQTREAMSDASVPSQHDDPAHHESGVDSPDAGSEPDSLGKTGCRCHPPSADCCGDMHPHGGVAHI